MKNEKRETDEITEVIHYLWNNVDQAQIMDIVDFAFKTCLLKAKKAILERLYDYGVDSLEYDSAIDKSELKKWVEKAEEILSRLN